MRRTKIIATVGPACDNDGALDALVAAGVDIFRLNYSHGTCETHAGTFRRIRAAAARAGRQVAILQDLAGPKIRTGTIVDGRPMMLTAGEPLRIVTGVAPGSRGRISTAFEGLARSVRPGDRLLLADGFIELRVDATDGAEIRTTVIQGGELGEHKGINAPGVPLPASAITPKDVSDLHAGLSLGVDIVAISFVQTAADVREARELMTAAGGADVPLVAKLERPQALEHLDEILAACEGVMVARGDLGLEMPLERVPTAQKDITRHARRRGLPVIVATQVFESMTTEPRPTRAEVSDAANAVGDGVDAIMLAGETAVGAFPARAVQMLDAVIREAESGQGREADSGQGDPGQAGVTLVTSLTSLTSLTLPQGPDHTRAICEAAVTLANRSDARAIVAVTRGGSTARRLSTLRPQAPIIAACGREETVRRLSLYWGVWPVHAEIGEDVTLAGTLVGQGLVARGLLPRGAAVVLVSVNPDLTQLDANFLKIQKF
jgi:pyruvate kinase